MSFFCIMYLGSRQTSKEMYMKKKKTLSKCGCGLKVTAGKDKKGQMVKPALTDVSGRVMAQPYIRFT